MKQISKGIVIGAGIISSAHIEGLQAAGVAVAAVVDPADDARRRIREQYRIPYGFAAWQEALALMPDVACICTPNDTHATLAVGLLDAGVPVICEKPMARTVAECDAMIAASRRNQCPLFIAQSQRFMPQHREMIRQLKAGAIGRPFLALSTFIGNEYRRMNDPLNWKCTPEHSGGGVIIDNGAHMIDLLGAAFGAAVSVEATVGRLVVEAENKAEDTALLNIHYQSGVVASLSLTFAARYSVYPEQYGGAGLRTEVFGTAGSLSCGNGTPPFVLVNERDGRRSFQASELAGDEPVSPVVHFVACLREGREPIVTMEDGRETVRLAQAAYRSAREKRRVQLSEITG